MSADVVLDDLGHQAGDGPPHAGDEMHDLVAARFVVECAFDAFDLTSYAAHTRQQLLFFTNCVGHYQI